MDKQPLLPIDSGPVELWYEGPTFLVAVKPVGMAMHPDRPEGRGTLVNLLFQSNRWLAEMEESVAPGVVHRLRPQDRGLAVVAKSDETAHALREAHAQGGLRFSYRIRVAHPDPPRPPGEVREYDRRRYGEITVIDCEAPSGNPEEIAGRWFGDPQLGEFVAYAVEIPGELRSDDQGVLQVALGHRVQLPSIELYTAPT